jgi:hypothetical protein
MKQSSVWITSCSWHNEKCANTWETNESNKLDLDENGWVKSFPAE